MNQDLGKLAVGDELEVVVLADGDGNPQGFAIAHVVRRLRIARTLLDEWKWGVDLGPCSIRVSNEGLIRIEALNCTLTYRLNGYQNPPTVHMAELVERIDHDTPEDGAS